MASPNGARLRLTFQTKVLIPVLALLVLGPFGTLWIVDRHLSEQAELQAEQSLETARAVFSNLLEMRARAVSERFRTMVNEPRLRATAQLGDGPTLRNQLQALFGEIGPETEFIVFAADPDAVLAAVHRHPDSDQAAFVSAAATSRAAAFDGEIEVQVVRAGGQLYHAVAVPVWVRDGGPLLGVWQAGVRLGNTELAELKAIARTEILLSDADGRVIAGTMVAVDRMPAGRDRGGSEAQAVRLGDRHFLMLSHRLDETTAETASPLRYALLSATDDWRQALGDTRRLLVWIGLGSVVLAGVIVSLIIRKVTQPLVLLRDQAEAVGRGDFSRRIERIANDETGELAEAFNAMTGNLHASRAELERTLQTLRETQAQLVQSEKLSAVGQFVAGVAHELNNPLTSVVGYADLLEHSPAHPEAKTYLQRINQAAERCRKIVQNLLSFSRQHPPERTAVRLEEVCDAVIEFLSYEMRHSGVKVERRYGERVPSITGDPHQLQQVVLNLANNARQAMEEHGQDGTITFTTEHRADSDRVILRIRDTGPGIAPEHQSRLFDPFFTTKAEGKGTGLGLSLCYGIIQEHKAGIAVESTPGQGAEFILDFPAAQATLTAEEALARIGAKAGDSAAPFATRSGEGRRALVIDDEVWIRDVAAEVLRGEGYEVETAEGGEEALRRVRAEPFDLLVCDWKMPGLNGMALFERIRAENKSLADSFLFMTGDVVSEGFQSFLRKYSRPCLPKPFSTRELRAAVAKLAAKG